MENILIHIGLVAAKLATTAIILPCVGTAVLFLYTWWARRRALESR
jgi:uncharacterized membrane protein YbaN (DUF454 family)